jgi:uncharacterized protein YjbI with pentapeptide repeats
MRCHTCMSPQPDGPDSTALPPQTVSTVTAKIRELAPVATALAALATGVAAVAALIFSGLSLGATNLQLKLNNAQLKLNEEGQLTDRYNAAVTNLGSSSVDVRLGGIYALQSIMRDSPPEEPTIVAVLCAFVRDHASIATAKLSQTLGRPHSSMVPGTPTDVQAALTVIMTRPHGHHPMIDLDTNVDLSGTDLAGAQLRNAYFSYANLTRANLTGADLSGAYLKCAVLADANLTGATLNDGVYLAGANLTHATVTRADLTGASLIDANLTGATFAHAKLTGTNFTHAIRRDAKQGGTKGLCR